MPFTAKLAGGERCVSMLDPADDALVADPLSAFECKGCGAAMYVRKGTYSLQGDIARRAHFAHFPTPSGAPPCPLAVYSEGETEAHRQIKALIAGDPAGYIPALRADAPTYTELERWLPEARRVADVYIETTSGHRLAIEVQLAPIVDHELQARSEAYLAADVTPVWVFAEGRLTDGCTRVLDALYLDRLIATVVFAREAPRAGA